jgi:V/A-type H+/Na+-transporting ATPase subunit D
VSTSRISAPPGRAGRLWIERRLTAARRAADLLDRKLRILQVELTELRDAAARTEQEWERLSLEADRRLLITVLLAGERAIAVAAGSATADVQIDYALTVGVSRPASASYRPPAEPDPWAGQLAWQAREAHRKALAAAARHAVAAGAVRAIEAEATVTRYRVRALRNRLIPALEEGGAQVALAIDELERADGARLRRALNRMGSG